MIRARVERTGERTGMVRELAAGWREIRSRNWLLTGIFAATLYHVANGVILVLVQVLAIQKLGGASAAGFISAAEGLGGVAGAAIALRWRPRRLLRAGWLTLALMALWPLAYVWPGMLVAVVAGAILGYAGLNFYAVAWDTAVQDHVPHRLLARVTSWDVLTSYLALPLGNALAGPVSVTLGVNRTLVIGAVILLVASLVPLLGAGTRRLRRIGSDVVMPPNPVPMEMQAT
jgi:Transmembrane secretion effector